MAPVEKIVWLVDAIVTVAIKWANSRTPLPRVDIRCTLAVAGLHLLAHQGKPMAVKGYVLINTTAKGAKHVLGALQYARAVESAEAVTGPYDIIAIVQAEDVDALGRVIAREIQNIAGVEKTLTCIVMHI